MGTVILFRPPGLPPFSEGKAFLHIFLMEEYHGMSGEAQVKFRRYSYVW